MKDDWAIIVGIKEYASLDPLQGPLNDARDFYDWVRSPTGGAVPDGPNDPDGFPDPADATRRSQIRLILSSNFAPPTTGPTMAAVQDAFDHLFDLSASRAKTKKNPHLGRRLYLYFSGHGFSPDTTAPDEVVVLMANARRQSPGYHISAIRYADWFYQSGFFDEIVLFMDCCREIYPSVAVQPVPYLPAMDKGLLEERKRAYGFATGWAQTAWEKKLPDANGDYHGVFTYTLLRGLNGAAVERDGRTITAGSLKAYLKSTIPNLITEEEKQAKPGIGVDPAFLPWDDLVLAELPVVSSGHPAPAAADTRFTTVRLRLPEAARAMPGKEWSIWWNGKERIAPLAAGEDLPGYLATAPAPDAPNTPGDPWVWEVQLPTGLYKLKSMNGFQPATSQLFEVSDTGGTIDVTI